MCCFNRFFIKFLLLFVGLLFYSAQIFSQKDTLVLYTKKNCTNCIGVKRELDQLNISYIELGLENNQSVQEMLTRLRSKEYHGTINLPVIFLNNNILHPSFEADSGFISYPLNHVIDYLKQMALNGKLQLKSSAKDTIPVLSETVTQTSDCEVEHNPIYLVCQSFSSENEAVEYKSKLILQGYSYAGVLLNSKQYLVYCKFFLDGAIAQRTIPFTQNQFPNAYLFQLPRD